MTSIKKLTAIDSLAAEQYKELVINTLARVLVFNAKRGGEIGGMTTEDYSQILESGNQGEFGPSELENKLSSRYTSII